MTSTFVEKTFAPMTQFTSEPRSRVSAQLLQAAHVNSVFDENVQAWWKTMLPDEKSESGKNRDPAACDHAPGSKTNAWHLYVKGPAQAQHAEALGVIQNRRMEYEALSGAQRQSWEDQARAARSIARVHMAPVVREAAFQREADVPGGPWSLSSSRGGMPGDWPVHSMHINETMKGASFSQVAKAWRAQYSGVWEEADDFPEEVHLRVPCKLGECLCTLTSRQADRYGSLSEEFKLALRHSGHLALSPLLFEVRCGNEVRYCLIGDNDWTHTLRCDFLLAEFKPRPGRAHILPGASFEVAIQREAASGQACEEGWPRIRSEKMFILNLVSFSSDPWHIYALHAEPDEPFSYHVTSKTKLDVAAMREAEVGRLEYDYAVRLLKKAY